MDDIQLWIYILFAIIYFVARGMLKKTKTKLPSQPQSSLETEVNPSQQPVSFEELLQEITGKRPLKKKERVIKPKRERRGQVNRACG